MVIPDGHVHTFEIFVESVGHTHAPQFKYANLVSHTHVGTDEMFQREVPAGQLQMFEEFVEPYGQKQAPTPEFAFALKYEFVVPQTQLDLSAVGIIPDGHGLHIEVVALYPPAQIKQFEPFQKILHILLTIFEQFHGHQQTGGDAAICMY
ncbi:Hypothetical_protein [Hexamita inflata]|uniref:Hypothetical_protein n=1 Tax=Hexamita inflata TaxID=28002 RepID=A0AA86R3E0_9EUKA|nr:Hypothetical protein HINF_LOCUS53002 [Hexamita inflata]